MMPSLSLEMPTRTVLNMTCTYFAQYPQRANITLQAIQKILNSVPVLFPTTLSYLNTPNTLSALTNTQTCPTVISSLYESLMKDIQEAKVPIFMKLKRLAIATRVLNELKSKKP